MSLRRKDLPRSVKTARMIPANAGLHRAYADKLTGLVRELSDSVTYWLLAEYKRQLPRVERMEATPVTALTARPAAGDASPARDLLARLRQQSRRWRKKFDEKAQAYAAWFAARALRTTTAAAREFALRGGRFRGAHDHDPQRQQRGAGRGGGKRQSDQIHQQPVFRRGRGAGAALCTRRARHSLADRRAGGPLRHHAPPGADHRPRPEQQSQRRHRPGQDAGCRGASGHLAAHRA